MSNTPSITAISTPSALSPTSPDSTQLDLIASNRAEAKGDEQDALTAKAASMGMLELSRKDADAAEALAMDAITASIAAGIVEDRGRMGILGDTSSQSALTGVERIPSNWSIQPIADSDEIMATSCTGRVFKGTTAQLSKLFK